MQNKKDILYADTWEGKHHLQVYKLMVGGELPGSRADSRMVPGQTKQWDKQGNLSA